MEHAALSGPRVQIGRTMSELGPSRTILRDWESSAFMTPSAPTEKSKFLGSGGSMVARLKLKGIDGRAPLGVEPAAQLDPTRANSPGPDIVRIDRLIALS